MIMVKHDIWGKAAKRRGDAVSPATINAHWVEVKKQIVGRGLCNVPTWALLEELKRRKGVTYMAKATGDFVGCIENAPAVALTVKLPLED